MLSKATKDRIIQKYRQHDSDTGSSEVQIAILTAEINDLSKHLKQHKKDFSSRRGLFKKVGERRRLLRYLKKDNEKSYNKLIEDLKIRVTSDDQT